MTKVGCISPSIQGNHVIARRAFALPDEAIPNVRRLLRAKNKNALATT